MHPRYEFLEVLGQGGCGVVRRALDRATNTQVAIKSLLPPYDAGAATRFEREAQALAALRHPHVIPVLDVLPGPPPSFVMPLVDGGSLQDRLKSGPLELQEVLSLGQTLGETLHVVHAHGLVHRDLKPANVLVHHGQPLLADFGLARGPRGHTITATGEVLGTPGYLAPEQALSLPIGPWTDVYGLGALLYALLTGEPPFKGQSALHAMQAVVQEPAPSVRAARPDVPEWVDAVLQRCMAKEPQQRFATALELTDALLPPGAARRGPPRAALALGAVVALVVGGAVWALVPRGAQGPTPPPAGPTPPARAPEPPPLPETDLVAPDVVRLLATSDTTWLDALPPRGTVRGPGPWPPPEELERFALLLFDAGFDPAREAILTRYPASGLEGARDAAEVARTIGYVQLEQELLAPFAAREWEVAVRLAELDPTAPLPDPQGYPVAPHVAADDLALLGCMRLEGGDLGGAQRAHLEDLTRRLPSLPPRQLVAWAGTLSGFRFTAPELDAALTAIEARLRRPSGLSLPQRLELLRSYGQICVRLEAPAGEPPATRALHCAQRVLAWSPANPGGLVLGLNALVELGRLPEALELGAWLLARKLPGRGGWFSAFLYCKALEQTLPPSLAPPPEHVLDALEQAYPAGQPLPKPLWTPLRPALDLAAAPHTHGRLRAFVRSLLPHAPGPALRAALVQWSARCTLHLEGREAALAELERAWAGNPRELTLAEADLALAELERDVPSAQRVVRAWSLLRPLRRDPSVQTAEGLRELAWLYLKAGLKYLAQDFALRAQERSGGADPELERLFEALRLPVGRRRTTVVDYDPASLGPVPEGSPPLPRPQGHPRPADLQRWKRLELEARYLELDEALFAEAGVDDLARLSPDAAWELCRTLRRLKLFRWESYLLSAGPDDPRCAVRFAVLNGADPEKVASVAEAAGASAAARHLAVALWTTREVFYQRDPRVRLRAQELLSAIDPASLDLEGRVERSVARVVCALDAEELPPIRALLPELDALLVEPGLEDGQAQELLEHRALALRAVGDYPEALRTYRAVLAFSPLQPEYLAWAAWCGGMQGSPEVTLPCARTLQSALPRSEFSYVAGLGLAALTAYRPQAVPSLVRRREELLDRGTEYCRALVRAGKPCAQFALPLCRLAVLLSRWEHLEALAEFGASKTADPRPFHTYRAIAAMERTRDPAQGPRAVPEASWPYVQLGLRCWDLRRGLPPASVTAEAERTLAEHPDDPGLALVAAEAFALAGDTARARALWEQARNQLDALGSRQLEVHFAAEWQGRLGD